MSLKYTRKIDPPHSAKSPRDGCREAGGHARRPEGALASPRGRCGRDRGPSTRGGSRIPEWVASPQGRGLLPGRGLTGSRTEREAPWLPSPQGAPQDSAGVVPQTGEAPIRPIIRGHRNRGPPSQRGQRGHGAMACIPQGTSVYAWTGGWPGRGTLPSKAPGGDGLRAREGALPYLMEMPPFHGKQSRRICVLKSKRKIKTGSLHPDCPPPPATVRG